MAYTKEEREIMFNEIISDIENGMSLRASLKKDNRPNKSTFFEWVEKDSKRADQYARAMEERIDVRFESIEADYMEQPQRDPESGKIDTGWVQLQRLKIDAKKWELSKLNPKKYGDRIALDQEIKDITEIKLTDATGDTNT